MNKLAICTFSFALALGGSIDLVSAQGNVDQSKTEELKKVDPVPPATGKNVPERTGTQEPTSKVQGTNPNADVFINGSLAVPGAATDTETAPAKYSDRNAASDRLSIAAFRLKHLTDDQRREIYQQLARERRGLALSPGGYEDHFAMVGAQLPPGVALRDLTLVPEAVAARFPELTGAAFMRSGTKVLLIDAPHSLVIGVLSAQ
jgi:hypothetical protein